MPQLSADAYQIGWVCALKSEYATAKAMLDERHEMVFGQDKADSNSYTLGRIHKHNVVVACLPDGVDGNNAAAVVATHLIRTFRWVRFGLLVGIGGGIPHLQKGIDIRLGDVVVSRPSDASNGVVQYDKGKSLDGNQFTRKGQLNKPPTALLTALVSLRSEHEIDDSRVPLYLEQMLENRPKMRKGGYMFPVQETDILQCSHDNLASASCRWCDNGKVNRAPRESTEPVIHYGIIASGNQVIKSGVRRDQLRDVCDDAMCVEMEAAGLIDTFPCLVVRGICDYADSSKNDKWHNYAAATAAAFVKELLFYVSAEQTSHEQPIQEILGQMNDTLKKGVQVTEEILEEHRLRSVKAEREQQTQQERDCLQVFKTSPYEQYKNINQDRVEGTCRWVLDHAHFRRWYDSPHNDLLWISADPGCGKSVLSRSLVECELAALRQTTTCYYFFKDNEQQDQLAPALCAVLHQLFSDQPHLLKHVIPWWEKNGAKIQNEVGTMWQILLDATSDNTADAVVCVFDALDECRDDDRRELVTRLCRFYGLSSSNEAQAVTKFVVTSRPYDNVQRWFEQTTSRLPQIRLRGEVENDQIRNEINLVIDQRLEDLASEFSLSTQHQATLRQFLRDMEHRTYLWLYLAIEDIRTRYRDSPDPEDAPIDKLPTSVENAYEQILQRITDYQRPHARKVLLIIVGSRRPLTIGEASLAFNAATAYEKGLSALREPNVSHLERHIREWCGLFVFINHSQLFLIHQTAKEFLLSTLMSEEVQAGLWRGSLSPTHVEREMAIMCITYLALALKTQESPGQASSNKDTKYSFFEYCAQHWTSHLSDHDIKQHKQLLENVLELYNTTREQFNSWFHIMGRASGRYEQVTHIDDQHAIAIGGHAVVLAERINRGKLNLDSLDSTGRSALMWAAGEGQQEVVQTLLDCGADINAPGGYGGALFAASLESQEKIVQILLDRGADINVQAGEYVSVLYTASANGHEKIVQILLNRGADINAQDNHGSALYVAALWGHEKIVQTLLDRGAHINAQGIHGSALYAASRRGHQKIVQILLNRGADINAEGNHGSALYAASANGHEKVVQILLDRGADLNAQGDYGSALRAAAERGHVNVVHILRNSGATMSPRPIDLPPKERPITTSLMPDPVAKIDSAISD